MRFKKNSLLTSKFHVKFHAKNRIFATRGISVFRVKFNEEFTRQAVNFERGLKKYGLIVQKSLSEKIYSEIKNSQTRFYFLYVKLATVKNVASFS